MTHLLARLNPFALTDHGVPTQLLLVCKLTMLVLLGNGYYQELDAPFIPFFTPLDLFHASPTYAFAIKSALITGCGMALFNFAPKPGIALAGIALLLHLLGTRLDFKNHIFLAACILLICGLAPRNRAMLIYRIQLALVYFGATLNKALDADWWNGRFFQNWMENRLGSPFAADFAQATNPELVYALMGWSTIGMETAMVVLIGVPRLNRVAIWMGAAFHFSTTVFAGGTTYGFFVPLVFIAFLGFDSSRNSQRQRTPSKKGGGLWQTTQERLKQSSILPFVLLGLFGVIERLPHWRFELQSSLFVLCFLALFPYRDCAKWIRQIKREHT